MVVGLATAGQVVALAVLHLRLSVARVVVQVVSLVLAALVARMVAMEPLPVLWVAQHQPTLVVVAVVAVAVLLELVVVGMVVPVVRDLR